MKKIFLFFAAVAMTAGVMSAQDINQATEAYNNGAMELQILTELLELAVKANNIGCYMVGAN